MDARIVTGLGAGALGLAGAGGMYAMMRHSRNENQAAATQEWETWRGELEAEFPNTAPAGQPARRLLADDAAQARFEQFLGEHPAPKFLNIKSENLRSISIDSFDHGPRRIIIPSILIGAAGKGGSLAAGKAGRAKHASKNPRTSQIGLALNIFGGAMGLGTIASSFALPKRSVASTIAGMESHVPTRWTE
jgi:hypothetical protein